jgi:hypothetical protein
MAKKSTTSDTEKPVKGEKKKFDASDGPTPEFTTAREFAQALAMKRNLVEVGSELLSSNGTKGASVRARMFETILEYLYGKPAAAPVPEEAPVRVIWDIPLIPPEEMPE